MAIITWGISYSRHWVQRSFPMRKPPASCSRLRPQDIADVLDMSKATDLVEQGYREAQDLPLINALRRRVHSRSNARISNFPDGVDGLGVIGSLTRGEQG